MITRELAESRMRQITSQSAVAAMLIAHWSLKADIFEIVTYNLEFLFEFN